MTAALSMGSLAMLPEPGGYISVFKIVFVLAFFGLWLFFGQWVNKDTGYVRTSRDMWNGIVLGGGAIGLVAWLLLPWKGGMFFLGWMVWLFVAGGAAAAYVLHRNARVQPATRVFTPSHVARVISQLGKSKEKKLEAVERVRISDHEGRIVPIPEDPLELEQFLAAQELLSDALWRRASEVDLACMGEKVLLTYRIDGVVTKRPDLLDRTRAEHALNLIKAKAGLNLAERRRPQTGRISVTYPVGTTNVAQIEVRTSGSTAGERLFLQVVSEESRLRLADLGLHPDRLKQLEELVAKPEGLVIFSGPKGSGVTTTLYAALRAHDVFTRNIHTLERKPLMDLENITQHVYDSEDAGLGFARRLQSIVRREPDVVMVADCPDRETAQLVVRAASSGKKLYLGMTAKDAFEALQAFMKLAEDPTRVAKALLGITCQRLIRKLCPACRQAYKPDPQLLRKVNLPADKIEFFYRPPSQPLRDKHGNEIICPNCQGSGYYGRTGVFELLVVDETVRKLLAGGAGMAQIRAACRKNRMLYLQEEGLMKVIDGITSMNEVIRGLRDEPAG